MHRGVGWGLRNGTRQGWTRHNTFIHFSITVFKVLLCPADQKSVSDVKQQMNQGYKLPPPEPLNGFPRVAQKLASDPDKTTTIFRRFDRLSARNLIYLEAELAELEARQDRLDEDKKSTSEQVRNCHTDWSTFERLATGIDSNGDPTNPGQAEKLELVLKIRSKIKEYRKTPLILNLPLRI